MTLRKLGKSIWIDDVWYLDGVFLDSRFLTHISDFRRIIWQTLRLHFTFPNFDPKNRTDSKFAGKKGPAEDVAALATRDRHLRLPSSKTQWLVANFHQLGIFNIRIFVAF